MDRNTMTLEHACKLRTESVLARDACLRKGLEVWLHAYAKRVLWLDAAIQRKMREKAKATNGVVTTGEKTCPLTS